MRLVRVFIESGLGIGNGYCCSTAAYCSTQCATHNNRQRSPVDFFGWNEQLRRPFFLSRVDEP